MKEVEKLIADRSFTSSSIDLHIKGTFKDVFILTVQRRTKKINNIYCFDVFVTLEPLIFSNTKIHSINSRNIHYHSRLNEKDLENIKDIFIQKLPEIRRFFIKDCF